MVQASKKFVLMAALLAVTGMADAWACSVSVNDTYQKNLLVAHAAGFFDLALTDVEATSMEDYGRSFEGGSGGGSCPDYLVTEARVTITHKPKPSEECTSTITVRVSAYLGDGVPAGPMEEVEFTAPALACSTSSGPYLRFRHRVPLRVPPRVIIRR